MIHGLRFKWTAIAALVIIGFASVFFVASNSSEKEPDVFKLDWIATNSAPKSYPIELVRADLVLADDTQFFVPDRQVVAQGWGVPGPTYIVGPDEKALPVRLLATWFSYVENRFYKVDTELPIEHFEELVRQGIASPQRDTHRGYDTMIFGFGPEGLGAVWLASHTNRIDVFRFRGEAAEVEWSEVIDNPNVSREDFMNMVLTETLGEEGAAAAKANGYSLGTWPRFQQRWPLDLDVSGAAEISLLRLSALNGEVFHYFSDMVPNIERRAIGAPSEILLHWDSPTGNKRNATIKFDPSETLAVFEALAAGGGDMTLSIELSASGNGVAVTLETTDMVHEFEALTAWIFKRE